MIRQIDSLISLAVLSTLLALSISTVSGVSQTVNYSSRLLKAYTSLGNQISAIPFTVFATSSGLHYSSCYFTLGNDKPGSYGLHWTLALRGNVVVSAYCMVYP
ncbi:MAG: hypothetical protein QXX17_00970 [Conexivisphaerales archaeon]